MKWSEFSFILGPSPLGGIGVFATHDLAPGVEVLTGTFQKRKLQTKLVPPDFKKYCIFIDDDTCYGPARFDRMEIGWFINHSADPNIADINEGGIHRVLVIRPIKAGDEVFIDYNQLDEPDHLKEPYYKPR